MGKTMWNSTRRRGRRGFTILEVTLALTIFMMMTLMFAAAFPFAVRAAQTNSSYHQAAVLTQHKMDQLRNAGFKTLASYSGLVGQGIVDAQNGDGSLDFTTADSLLNYFPQGSTGTIVVTPDTTAGVPAGQIQNVTVTITWSGQGGRGGSYTATTKIANY